MKAVGRRFGPLTVWLRLLTALLFFGFAARLAVEHHALADDATTDPYLGKPDAIDEGDSIYHSKCIICHGLKGGRGPNLFQSTLTDEQFMHVVINGRKGTVMPAWGLRLSPDDVWKVHSFIKAHPAGL
jgi:mono/diheme cytochrome c family protein